MEEFDLKAFQAKVVEQVRSGKYNVDIFAQLPQLLDISKAKNDLGRYVSLEKQFQNNNNKPYYPDNYLQDSDIDKKERINYSKNLIENRKCLFELFNVPISLLQEHQKDLHPNK